MVGEWGSGWGSGGGKEGGDVNWVVAMGEERREKENARMHSDTTNRMKHVRHLSSFHAHGHGHLEAQSSTIHVRLDFVSLFSIVRSMYPLVLGSGESRRMGEGRGREGRWTYLLREVKVRFRSHEKCRDVIQTILLLHIPIQSISIRTPHSPISISHSKPTQEGERKKNNTPSNY